MNIAIIGAARSGLAAALLAKSLGHSVFLSESRLREDFADTEQQLESAGVNYEFGANTEKALDNADLIITSPGVPPDAWIITEAEKRAVPVISELEFAWRHCKNQVIAITGTNGKTTTTSLIAYIFNNSGKKAVTCGNIGNPMSNVVKSIPEDTVIVVEVSSYQLDRITSFNPDVAVILNISPDHLAYHKNMENYALTKYNIAANHNENNLLILNADDELTLAGASHTKGKAAYFSMQPVDRGIYNRDGKMCLRYPNQHKEEEIMLFEEVSLPGTHNAYNSMAAALAARAFEITNENIRDSLMKFEGVEHRLEFVRNINGVDYINDSKATNINATWYALSSYNSPLIWIAGGRGDSNNYPELDKLVQNNVKCIIAIGEEADNIFNHFSSMVRCYRFTSMEDAVSKAYSISEKGDIVLFTPACKSFDMFINYEHRGEIFKEIVNKLKYG
ncbi:UDP-N-acetylmuramoyl-L-alanine--D-glutamate ligase [Bacteroidota bacterium]